MSQDEQSESVDRLIAQVSHFHHIHIYRGLESFGLYRGQPRLLHQLWQQDGMTHTELANRLQVQPATISKTVHRMERSGFIERCRDPDDERVSRVYLTNRGREVRAQVESWFQAFESTYTEGLSDDDLNCLRRLLVHIRDRLITSYEDTTECELPEGAAKPHKKA